MPNSPYLGDHEVTRQDHGNPFQFAYKQGSTEEAEVTLVYILSKHLAQPKTNARALFLDFSSAFNAIQPDIILSKMIKFQMNPYLIDWYFSVLTNRVKLVKVNDALSSQNTSVGVPCAVLAPLGCVPCTLQTAPAVCQINIFNNILTTPP